MMQKKFKTLIVTALITTTFLISSCVKKDDITSNNTTSSLTVTVIGDIRCTNCGTDGITTQLKNETFLTGATFIEQDFSDAGVQQYLIENSIKTLPAFIFSNNKFDDNNKMKPFLEELPNKSFLLNIDAQFDPFVERSERGFLKVDKNIVSEIKKTSYIVGNPDAKITWLEYSDLECPYCAKLHKSGTIEAIESKYGDKINKVFNHFPLSFHKNASIGAQILECVGAEKGSEAFYTLLNTSFSSAEVLKNGNIDTSKSSSRDFIIDEAVKLGADKDALETCLKNETMKEKVEKEMQTGSSVFGITGTPGNIIINNETGEYEILSGAVPTEYFVEVIDKLLAE